MLLPGSSLPEEIKRRSAAISTVATYCHLEEGKILRNQRVGICNSNEMEDTNDLDKVALKTAGEAIKKERRPTIYFLCLGNEQLAVKQRTHYFYTLGDLSRYFKRRYLAKLKDGEGVNCNMCQLYLEDSMYLQRHTFDAHGTVS